MYISINLHKCNLGGAILKIKSGFMLRNIADNWIVVPLGERVVDFNGLITLSETGAFLWKKLETISNSDMLIKELLIKYDIDETTAKADVLKFIDMLKEGGVLEI